MNRLGTLTYRGLGVHDPKAVREDVAEFFRHLKAGLGVASLPYVWVPEWHKSGHGLHLHFAVGQFIRRSLIESSWGNGFVHITQLNDLPAGSGRFSEARMAARYLSKYVSKAFESDPVPGLHRYDVGQGYQPRSTRITDTSLGGVLLGACELMGARPSRSWTSYELEEWSGPPLVHLEWS